MKRVVVSGMVAADPFQGGASWAVLQYVLGLERLGWEVLLVEEWEPPTGGPLARTRSAGYFIDIVRAFGLEDRAALLRTGSDEAVGLGYAALRARCRDAELLLNISGILTDPDLIEDIPVRAYVDLDPVFNQFWQESGIDMRFAAHNRFVTVGQSLGTPACPVPTLGLDWIPTLPPVVLQRWPVADGPGDGSFTSVGNWRGYGSVEHEGVQYGQRVHSMRNFMELPRRSDARFRLALAIHSGERSDLEAIAANGWELVDPVEAAGTPVRYQRFIQGSGAELGIAKSGYVLARSGWFSDRSACYLASGRPVLAQETGFSRFLPVGEGLLSFETVDDAVAGVESIRSDYGRHARRARQLAEELLDSDRVLSALLDRLGKAA
jgi:hypothetical protein